MLFNWDGYGALLTNEGSNGDSAHHTAYYYYMNSVVNNTDEFEKLEIFVKRYGTQSGWKVEFTRHPDREPYDFSRDQYTAMIAAASRVRSAKSEQFYSDVVKYYKQIENNYGFFFNEKESGGEDKPWWNRDWLDFSTKSLYKRATERGTTGPYRWIGDVHLLSSILFRLWKVKDDPSSTADENLILHLMVARQNNPTWISDLAAKIYFKYRPDNDGGKGWRGAMIDFWSRNGTYIPGMAYITIKAVEKVFGKDCY